MYVRFAPKTSPATVFSRHAQEKPQPIRLIDNSNLPIVLPV
jgi:hypothetical protein